jgi:RNA polymerase sigma-70 factor (ECF subfamily)
MDSSELRDELERHHRESYGWALGCCSRDPLEAESVLQAVYLKVLEGKARFDGKSAFKTWLFAVIRKTAAGERRKNYLRRLLPSRRESEEIAATKVESPDEKIYQTEIRLAFRRALADLPGRQREVLQLVFYHDLSLAEAAEVMGVSLGSARTHYERGKKRLRQLMEAMKVFDELRAGRKNNPRAVPATETRG